MLSDLLKQIHSSCEGLAINPVQKATARVIKPTITSCVYECRGRVGKERRVLSRRRVTGITIFSRGTRACSTGMAREGTKLVFAQT